MAFTIKNVITQFRNYFLRIGGLELSSQTQDNNAVSGAGILFYRSDTKRLRFQDSAGAFYNLATDTDVATAADNAAAAPFSTCVVLARHTNSSVAARFTPGMAGKIRKITAFVVDPVTTGSKAATFTPAIGGVAVTGGALALTSANCTPVGAKIDGTAITAGNTFAATDEITVVASSVTAFAEGQVAICLFFDPA